MYEESEYKKPRRYRTKPQLGSVSSGTMRPEDLIPEFVFQVEEHGNPAERKAARAIERASEKEGYFDDEDGKASEDVDTLFDILDAIAGRHNMHFGAQEGDGACYGFWPNLPEEFNGDYVIQDHYKPDYLGRVVIELGAKVNPILAYDIDSETWKDLETGARSKHVGLLIRRRMVGCVYEVNDHGNVTCYRITSKGKLVEIWACV